MRLLIYGYGFSGRVFAQRMTADGWTVLATFRNDRTRDLILSDGLTALDVSDGQGLARTLLETDALLVTPPPGALGCPALNVLAPALIESGARPGWTGYLSTTGVYGDRRGGWVRETTPLSPKSAEGTRRVAAERDWLALGETLELIVTVFRLPGIYGPGRSAFDRLREGRARRIATPGQVFSRIHVADLAAGLAASIARPSAGAIYNLCDDEPAPNSEVIAYAAGLLGLEPPPEVAPEDANLTPTALRFYAENKRVSNARAKSELGWQPAFASYREGLSAILKG